MVLDIDDLCVECGEEAIEDHLCNDCLSDRDREKARDQREAFIEAMS